MREIKFRVWDKECYKMFHNITIKNIIKQTIEGVESGETFGHWLNITKHELMEYTGLKDKNGAEIYEGDIVVENSYPMYDDGLCNYRCVVVWYSDQVCFGLEMHTVSERVRGCAVPKSIDEYENLEIIGNIHGNPELLK